jgi:hypothetical protein
MAAVVGLPIGEEDLEEVAVRLSGLLDDMDRVEAALGPLLDDTDPIPPVYPRDDL